MQKRSRFVRQCAVSATGLILASIVSAQPAPNTPSSRPNIVLILADDLGFSDLGAYGAEVSTPNIDALAHTGMRLTNFHAAPSCSPTRSMLLTGTDNHTAGVGAMAEVTTPAQKTRYGYEGQLTNRVATLAERLKAAGYATVMSGKWHLGMESAQQPSARGFDKSFALLQGAHNHFGKGGFGPNADSLFGATYVDDGKKVAVPDDFYSSDYFTTQLIEKMDKAKSDQPVFAYLAFTAPHAPLQAPAAIIEKYRGRYDAGWAALRGERVQRMKTLGIVPADTVAHEVDDSAAWSRLSTEEQKIEARKMEVYAAMIERMDWNVGRVVDALKRDGRFENTVMLFISDNGPAGETVETYGMLPGVKDYLTGFDNSIDSLGGVNSFVFHDKYWAQAGSAPFWLYKSYMAEGGTRVPAIISYPRLAPASRLGDAYATVMDIVPTVLNLAAVAPSRSIEGRVVAPIRGQTMVPYLAGRATTVHAREEAIAAELHGQRSVVEGDWKLTYIPQLTGPGKWQLFNLKIDRSERVDVSDQNPELTKKLIAAWERYAKSVNIPPPEARRAAP